MEFSLGLTENGHRTITDEIGRNGQYTDDGSEDTCVNVQYYQNGSFNVFIHCN